MAKKEVSNLANDLDIDENFELASTDMKPIEDETPVPSYHNKPKVNHFDNELVSCLTNERIIVRFVPKQTGIVTNPKHILYGGMAETAVRWLTIPMLPSGLFFNVLTEDEQAFLENIMGFEPNHLSIYKKVDNFWENFQIRLTKQDNFLNLSDPNDYIKYKVLLANTDLVAPSLEVLQDKPKATYQFVLIQEGEELKEARKDMSATMQAYMEFGKIQTEHTLLRVVLETIEGKPTASNTKLEFLQSRVNHLIQADAKLFLKIANDPLLKTKALIKLSVEKGLIGNRGGFYYLKPSNTPLCEDGQEPTFNNAATYLSNVKRQEIRFKLESQIK